MFTATCKRGEAVTDERLVLRLQNPEPAIYPAQASEAIGEIEIQHRVMTAIAEHSSVPVAPIVGYEADAAVVGRPFFVMRFVEGDVPIEDPLYTEQGFFTDAAPEQRRALVTSGLDAMARLHAVDWQAAGLQWLVPEGVGPRHTRPSSSSGSGSAPRSSAAAAIRCSSRPGRGSTPSCRGTAAWASAGATPGRATSSSRTSPRSV